MVVRLLGTMYFQTIRNSWHSNLDRTALFAVHLHQCRAPAAPLAPLQNERHPAAAEANRAETTVWPGPRKGGAADVWMGAELCADSGVSPKSDSRRAHRKSCPVLRCFSHVLVEHTSRSAGPSPFSVPNLHVKGTCWHMFIRPPKPASEVHASHATGMKTVKSREQSRSQTIHRGEIQQK